MLSGQVEVAMGEPTAQDTGNTMDLTTFSNNNHSEFETDKLKCAGRSEELSTQAAAVWTTEVRKNVN